MATAPVNGPTSSNVYLDALQWGGWRWENSSAAPGDPVTIQYFLDTYRGIAWEASEKAALVRAFDAWSDVANITFVETSNKSSAQLIERLVGNSLLPGALGEHGTPDSAALGPEYDGPLLLGNADQAYGYFNYSYFTPGGFARGGYDFVTLVHELGHALGLAHPHDTGGGSGLFPGVSENVPSDLGTNNFNQGIYSVMSYNDGWVSGPNKLPASITRYGYEAGPMAFDIAAIQDLYGANTTTASGDNVYRLPTSNASGTFYSCIWDTGGIDTISYSGKSNVVIDLRAATLDTSSLGGGVLSYTRGIYGGYTIANSVEIENATGGSGNDRLRGSETVANSLSGRNGNDVLIGFGGGDRYNGGEGLDTVSYASANTSVILSLATGEGTGGASDGDRFVALTIEIIVGTNYGDDITGDGAANRLYGGSGSDVIDGGRGRDILDGGSGNDTVSYDSALSAVRVTLSTSKEQKTLGGGYDTLKGFENIEGSAFNDRLTGNGGNNRLDGGDGNDVLIGGAGSDVLTGGMGADVFVFNTALSGTYYTDTIIDFETGIDILALQNEILKGIGGHGVLNAAYFVIGSSALDANDRLIYDDVTGLLIFDSNGFAAGGNRVMADIGTGLALTSADFLVI